jgi:hypothetical protein
MRDGFLHHRTLIAAVAAIATLAVPWAAPARADVAQVTIVSPGGAQQTLALGALAGSEDVVERGYVVRDGSGERTRVVTGFSLAALLAAAGADPYGFSFLEVQRAAGGAVLLSRHQALDPGAFADGPPVVFATADGTGFLRPSGGSEDANGGDSFSAPQGISIALRKGSHLRVRAKASPQRTKPGQPVRFEAVVERAGSGESLTYSWYFDDDASASGRAARHSFAKPGSYDVVVGVTTNGDDVGASDVITVQVGAASAGPDRKGGGSSEAKGAPDHGAATGPSSGAAGSDGGAETVETPKSRFEKRPAGAKGTTKSEASARVEGELFGAEVHAPAQQAAPQAAARRGKLDGDGGGGGVPAAAWGALATLGLLGTGALAEAGHLGAGLRTRLRGDAA